MHQISVFDLQTMTQRLIQLVQSGDSLFSDWVPWDEEWVRDELGIELSAEEIEAVSLWIRFAACSAIVPLLLLWCKGRRVLPEGFLVERFDRLHEAITDAVVDQPRSDLITVQSPRTAAERRRLFQAYTKLYPNHREIHEALFSLWDQLGTTEAVTD